LVVVVDTGMGFCVREIAAGAVRVVEFLEASLFF
jgi:hypothetical protein